MTQTTPIKTILFDFDGVIIESVEIKTDVFRYLFRSYPRFVERIAHYHRMHSGVSRFHKFDYIYRYILKRPLTPLKRRALGNEFANQVFKRVVKCRTVNGALPFLRKYHHKLPLYVISATPQKELERIIRKRHLRRFFKDVYGYPTTKKEAIQKILKKGAYSRKNTLMVGDAKADWDAAHSQRIHFIGRTPAKQRSFFPKHTIQIRDLKALDRKLSSICF